MLYKMIKKYALILILLTGFNSAFTQQDLSLEQAVMEQYRTFYPQSNFNVQWIPNTEKYSYFENYVQLVSYDVNKKATEKLLSIQELNQVLGTQLYYFQGFKWKNEHSFYVNDEKNYYLYNLKDKASQLLKLDKATKNDDLHIETGSLAYTIANNLYIHKFDGEEIAITTNDDSNIVSGQTIARSEMGISKGTFWSPNANFLAFYQKDETNVHDYPLLNINEYPGQLKSIKYPMAGQPSEQAKVGVYNVAEATTVYISPRTDKESYLTNLSWTPDEKHIIIVEVNRDQKHLWVDLYNAQNGEFVKTLFEETSKTWVEPQHAPYFIPNTKNEFVWVSERDGFKNLYHYDLEGKLLEQLTDNNFVVKSIEHITNDGVIYFTATGENPLNTLLYSVTLKGKQSLITKNEGTHRVEIHPSGKWFYDIYSSHDTPNKELLINTKGKEIKEVVNADNPLKNFNLGQTTIQTLISNDDHQLYTRTIYPHDFDENKKYPVLVYVYGGPHAQLITNSWLSGASLWMHWMANQGYIVFTLDNRGSANRGVEFEHGVHRQLGTFEMADQLKGVDYLKTLSYVDANRIAVHGWSFGGFMTGTLLLKAPDIFKVGVAGGPVTDWKFYEIMYGERYMDTPQQNPEGYRSSSLIEHADKLKGKLLLIHGTMDDVVVMQHNYTLVQKFIELGKHVDFFPYPMHKHNVSGKDRIHLMEKVLNYVLENN